MFAASFPPSSPCPSAHPTSSSRLRAVPCSAAPHPLQPPPHRIPHRAQSASPASTVLSARRGQPARRDCLHRASESRPPLPSRRASTMDAPASRGDKIRVTPRSPTSCSCSCCCYTVRSMRRCRPPCRRASIRLSKAHVARVCFKCFRCFI
jgi:hypothetical protein